MNNLFAEKKESLKRAIEQKVASLMAMIDDETVVRNAEQLLTTEKALPPLPMKSPDASLKPWLPDRCKAKNSLRKERRW